MADFRSRFPRGRLARLRRAGARRRSLRSAPSILRREGDDFSSSRQLVVSSSSRRGRGRLPPRTAKDDRTTRRQDRPCPPSGRGGRLLVVPSARRPVVLPPRKGSAFPGPGPRRLAKSPHSPVARAERQALSSRKGRKVRENSGGSVPGESPDRTEFEPAQNFAEIRTQSTNKWWTRR